MKKTALALVSGAMLFTTLAAQAQMNPVGLWRSIDDKTGQARAEIRIKDNGQGALNGTIEKAIIPSPEPLCVKCTDDRKDKPKLGLEVIRGAKKVDGKDLWEGGKILDPDSGALYSLRMTPIDGGAKLEVRGILFGPLGRTQTWTRIQ